MKQEQNYRQISPLCISGKKHMETAVSCTIIFHISAHNLVNPLPDIANGSANGSNSHVC